MVISNMPKKALYTSINDGLKALIQERAEKEGRSVAEVIEDLLKKGLEADRIIKEAEKVKEDFSDHAELKSDITELKQKYTELSSDLKEIQDIIIDRLNGFKRGFNDLKTNDERHHATLNDLQKKVVVLEERLKSHRHVKKDVGFLDFKEGVEFPKEKEKEEKEEKSSWLGF